MGVNQCGGAYDNGPQLLYAASRHTGLTVFDPYKSKNVFHELYKKMAPNFLSIAVFYL